MSRLAWIFISSLWFAACSGGGGGSVASVGIADQRIGAAGGVLEVATGDLAGLRIEVPPGATSEPMQVRVAQSIARVQPGFSNLSRAMLISPNDRSFDLPVDVTLPFDAGRQSRPAVVLALQPDGRVVEVAGAMEPDTGLIQFQTLSFPAFYWVAERLLGWVDTNPTGIFGSTPGYLPLNDGDAWTFGEGIVVTMTSADAEPNLGGSGAYRLVVESPDQNLGLYLQRQDMPPFVYGPTKTIGQFSTNGGADYQQLHEANLFLPAEITMGQDLAAVVPALVFSPYGATAPTAQATAALRVAPRVAAPVETPVGRFADVIRIEWSMQSLAPGGELRQAQIALVLARGVGPVALEAFGVTSVLQSGVVAGSPIVGAD